MLASAFRFWAPLTAALCFPILSLAESFTLLLPCILYPADGVNFDTRLPPFMTVSRLGTASPSSLAKWIGPGGLVHSFGISAFVLLRISLGVPLGDPQLWII